MSKPLPPFSCNYSPNVPELLYQLKCTLALSTYQAGKVIFLSATEPEKMIQLPRTFDNAMGIASSKNKMAVACKNEVIVLANTASMAANYPPKPNTYDGLYLPRASYYTGQCALHDMSFQNGKLLAINTLFSCISEIDDAYSFTPVWKPKFISQLHPEDRCHLNGMAMGEEGSIEYVTALGETNVYHGWRENKLKGGIIIHVPSGEIITRDLPMPHSPRIYNNKLYVLLSASGELIEVDINSGSYKTIVKMKYFVRGMAKFDDYLFIGHSKLRHNSSAFRDLPIAKHSTKAGIQIIHLPTASIVGYIKYENSVDEIYDVKVLPGLRRPGIVSHLKDTHILAITTPDDNFWAEEQKKES